MAAGEKLAEISGTLASILTAERTALNFLGHLSGIASLTARFVAAAAEAGGDLRVWDTRKTTPGLRSLEKAAVRAGGGANHRGNLSDWVLLKDNHVALAGGIREAVERALEHRPPGVPVEVECDSLADVREALEAGATHLLLDNMDVDEIGRARELAGDGVVLEASGGITPAALGGLRGSGLQFVSLGFLTHSAPALDLSMSIAPIEAP